MAVLLLLLVTFSLFEEDNSGHFPELEGFQKNGGVEIYSPDNLYDYINGAADSYLNYDFQKLYLQRYKGEKEQSIKIEVYEHSSNITAFGIYSSERPFSGNWVEIGSQGYCEDDLLNFYKGQHYVKIMTHNIKIDEKKLISIANSIAENLTESSNPPGVFKSFPSEGRLENSEKYIHKNFLGYESLAKAYIVNYESNETEFELFLIKLDNAQSCRNMLEEYFDDIKIDKSQIDEGIIHIKDPYLGKMYFSLAQNRLTGIINCSSSQLAEKYLDELNKNLARK